MKKIISYLIAGLLLLSAHSTVKAQGINIIPYPSKVSLEKGEFIITSDTKIVCDKELSAGEDLYIDILSEAAGLPLKTGKQGGNEPSIFIQIDKNSLLPEEGYTLHISPDKIELGSSSPKGILYGIQSLRQLIHDNTRRGEIKLPAVKIEDFPRFEWRGLMLDVSRTFMNLNFLKRYIDLMSMYKLNTLHLHFCDDQGWRIEIKKYPRLTSVGSQFDSEYNEMGGYYTQEEIKDLVEYATRKNVTIVPEFELPGHVCGVLTSYPELSCTGIPPGIHPFFKGPGIHKEILCAGKDEVYEFVFNVLDELLELFPSRIIHIGGDEAPKVQWKECSHCQKKMRDNGLKNEEQLQGYFVTQVGNYLRDKGRLLIGWDEILDGGNLVGDEVVMYWRSWAKVEAEHAASNGFKVVSCPTSHCYFDYSYEASDTKKVYMYDPVPEGTSPDIASNYIGVQANFWSHIDRSEKRIDRQLFPRLFGLSEVGWSRPESRNWERFKESARKNNERLRLMNVNCHLDNSIYYPE